MAFNISTICEIRPGGSAGVDTNSGLFDPALTGMDTTLAATSATGSAPSCTSSNAAAVAGDVGNFIFVQSGTNWVPGWWPISGTSSGAWTINAAVGAGNLYRPSPAAGVYTYSLNTTAGIATTASPTAGTWTIDYSQANAANQTFTGETVATTTVTCTSGVITVAWIANSIYISLGGTVARYIVTAIGTLTSGFATTFTIDRSGGASAGGTNFALGGALATTIEAFNTAHSGGAGTLNSLTFFLKNTGTLLVSGAQTSMPGGAAGKQTMLIGYNAVRGDLDAVSTFTNFPEIQGNNIISNLLICGNSNLVVRNIWGDGGTGGTKTGICFNSTGNFNYFANCKATGFSQQGFVFAGVNTAVGCYASSCASGATAGFNTTGGTCFLDSCISINNTNGTTCVGFLIANSATLQDCIAANNSAAVGDGIQFTATNGLRVYNCSIYNNGRHGINATASGGFDQASIRNNAIVSNGGVGIKSTTTDYSTSPYLTDMDYNFFYGNTSGSYSQVSAGAHDVAGTGVPFTNAGSGDFSLNNVAGQGAAMRGNGWPGAFPAAVPTTGYLDIGAAQSQNTGGGPISRITGARSIGTY